MKRIVCLCLAVLLLSGLLSASAESGQEEELFTFWDIPFGTSRLDFFNQVNGTDGFIFFPGSLEGFNFWRYYGFLEDDQILRLFKSDFKAYLFGYEVEEALAGFDHETDGLRILLVQFNLDKVSYNHFHKMQADIFSALCEMFGELPSDGVFNVDVNGEVSYYDLPIKSGELDLDALASADKILNYITLSFDWRNVRYYSLGFYAGNIIIYDKIPAPLEREESLGYYTDVVPETVRIYDSGL